MAIPQRILDLDNLFKTAMDVLPPNAKHPKHLLGNLRKTMDKYNDLGISFNTDDIKQAFDRWNYKNRSINTPNVVMSMDNPGIVKSPKVGTNFINDAGEVYIFEKSHLDKYGQNNFQFRSPTGTVENVLGDKLPNSFKQIDTKYDLDNVKAYHDDMYELYTQKQIYDKTPMSDKGKYYDENVRPVVDKIKNRINNSNIDVINDKQADDLLQWGYHAQNWGAQGSNEARRQQQRQRNIHNQQQRTIDMNDASSWTDDDIKEMAQGDPEHAQELINQRNAAGSQNQSQQQVNQDIPDSDQAINNVEQNIKRNTQQTQQTVNQQTQSDWIQKIKDEGRARRGVNRIDIDESTAQVKVDTSDPYNIYKTTTDAQGNTRTQHWNRKDANSGDATLVSDTTFNADSTYNNITGEYSGPDRSHIDWINADEWGDDYILNRAGDNEELMNSMMNARERKIQANEKYRQEHPDMNNPNDVNTSNNVDTPSPDKPIPKTTHNVDTKPQVDPNNPLTWTEDYMDEISEGDPTYYNDLKNQKLNAERIERFKNIDSSNPTTWTDEYIQHTAANDAERNWMNQKMRDAKNLDTVDEINRKRQNQEPSNRQEKRQQQKENKQKGNQQKPLTKKERERQRQQKEFEARQRAMGNNPDEVKKNNKKYNEEQNKKKKQQQQQNPNQQNKNKRGPKLFDENDPTTWTKKDIKDMADGDPERFKDLTNRFKEAKKGNIIGDYNHVPDIEDFDFHDAPMPDMPLSEMPDTEWVDDLVKNADDIAEEAIEGGAKGLGKLGTMDKVMSGVNLLGAVGDYKTARRKGHGVISSAVRAGAQFAIYEALGLWALPVTLLQHTPGAIIKGADMLYKENRRMNSAANNQIFGDAEFMDTQQLATMRQSGMEMAKMAQYNLQQTLMGNEATYLHR